MTETAECQECGMVIHVDDSEAQPPWFERRICTLCGPEVKGTVTTWSGVVVQVR